MGLMIRLFDILLLMLSLVMEWAMRKVASNGWRVHGGAIYQLQCARDNGGGGVLQKFK